MELWDLYDINKNKINKKVKRGSELLEGEYHLVVNVWLKNSKDEYIITQRAQNKTFAYQWECTGGSAISGESSIEAAIREVKEEINIDLEVENGILLGSTIRKYPSCSDILDVWIFNVDFDINDIILQEEEICNVKWASREDILELYNKGEFEANYYFKELMCLHKVYYIGFNANDAICNETFFDGSITIYPNNEKGNIFFTTENVANIKHEDFLYKYKLFVQNTINSIVSKYSNTKFLCFNERVFELCKDIKNLSLISLSNKKRKFML